MSRFFLQPATQCNTIILKVRCSHDSFAGSTHNGSLSDAELNTKLQHSYEQSLAGEGMTFNEVFDKLEKSLVQ